LYFRQDYLLPGFLISVASLGLLVAAVAKRGRATPSALGESEVIRVPTQPRPGGKRPSRRQSKSLVRSSWYRPLFRVLAFSGVVAFVGLLAYAEIRHLRWFQGKKAGVEADVEYRIGEALSEQQGAEQARPHFIEALRLAKRAYELTDYRDPLQYLRLAVAYAATGSPDKAMKTLRLGRDLSLATGEDWLADGFQKRMNEIAARNAQAGESK
jgi:tetratricopeptide (TPR) repeat protein